MSRTAGSFTILVLLGILFLCGCTTPASRLQTITVTGSGKAMRQPDIEVVNFGFWTKDEDPNIALLNSQAKLNEIVGQLMAVGVEAKDIQNLGVSMNTEQIMGPDGYPTDRLLYAVNQNSIVTVRNGENIGEVVNTIRLVAGAPYLYGLTLSADFSEDARAQAMAEAELAALDDAAAHGQRLAQSLGLTLGPPLSVTTLSQQIGSTPLIPVEVMLEVSYEAK